MIDSQAFAQCHRFTDTQFVRKRALPVGRLVLFLLNLVQGALQAELDRFYEVLHGVHIAARMVTKAAFSLARRKLHFGAFVEINDLVVERFYAEQPHGPPVHRWHGWRLLAIDGSTALLPRTEAVRAWFGVVAEGQAPPCVIGRVSTLYDVLNRIIVEAHLAPYRIGEHELALVHLGRVGARDLVLFDRGYPAFWLFSLLRTRGLQFCMRATVNYCPAVDSFVRSGQAERIIDLSPGSQARLDCRGKGLSLEPVRVRLVRVELHSGEVEVLITSLLDVAAYPHEHFAALYHQRWGIEEGYKVLKSRVAMENFTGKSVHAVMQDFHAKIVTTNLTALLAHQAQSELAPTTRRHPVRVNLSHALARMKDTVVRFFTAANRHQLLSAFIDLLRRTVEAVRPGRSFPRIQRTTRQRFHPTYKRCG